MTAAASLSVWKRERPLMMTGKPDIRSLKVEKCCWTSSVVGHQDGDLLAVLDGLEGGADGDLGLAVADVAAHQPVHRDLPLHVLLDLVDGRELVDGLHEREGVLELALPGAVRAEGVPLGGLPRGVQLDQLGGDLLDRLAGPALALGPVGATEPVERGLLAADVPGDLVERVGRHVEPVGRLAALGGAVLDHQVLAGRALHRALHHLDVAADAVLLVHDVVAGLELERVDLVLAPGRHLAHVLGGRALAGQVVAGEHRQAQRLVDEPVLERPGGHVHQAALGLGVEGLVRSGPRRRARAAPRPSAGPGRGPRGPARRGCRRAATP